MSTLQSLLSNIKVEQSGGAPMVPEDADGYVSLTPSGQNLSNAAGDVAPHHGVPNNMRLDLPGSLVVQMIGGGSWAVPDNFDHLVRSLRDISPLKLGKHIIQLQNSTGTSMRGFHSRNGGLFPCVMWATKLIREQDAAGNPGSGLRVEYINQANTINVPTTGALSHMISAEAVARNSESQLYNYTRFVAIVMGYVADNCFFDVNGKLAQHNTSGAAGYEFLPVGGVGNYLNHLPNNTQINGLPGAMALASFVPINLNPWMPMREGSVGQTGGGAFVLSNAPSVAKYCADSNYLVGEVKKQLSLMGAKNMGLSANSENKVKNLLPLE